MSYKSNEPNQQRLLQIAPDLAIDPLNKGLGLFDKKTDAEGLLKRGWNLLREDLSLPVAVLWEEHLRHNHEWMRRFIAEYGVKLAPHGKTTMAPKLFAMQLAGGAWGITLATAPQTLVAYVHGVRRVLMANQLVGAKNMELVARMLADCSFEFYCLVDSAENVEQLGAFFGERGLRLNVLLELGVEGGRTGVRDDAQETAVLDALARWKDVLALCGVELYEGVLKDEEPIRAFLRRAVKVTRRLMAEKRLTREPALLSGAGSAWFDVVAEELTAAGFGRDVEIVLRPGCYLTHDVGAYREAHARMLEHNAVAREMHASLQPALQVWAYVQSRPEAEKAIVAMGKRDAAFDSGLPVPRLRYRRGDAAPQPAPTHWTLTKMMDQHAYMQIGASDSVCVGDMIGFDISHPCLTFDKWRVLPVLNVRGEVVDMVQTFF